MSIFLIEFAQLIIRYLYTLDLTNKSWDVHLYCALMACGVRSIAVKSSEVNTEKGLKTRHFRELEVLFRLSDFLVSWYLLPGEKIG